MSYLSNCSAPYLFVTSDAIVTSNSFAASDTYLSLLTQSFRAIVDNTLNALKQRRDKLFEAIAKGETPYAMLYERRGSEKI